MAAAACFYSDTAAAVNQRPLRATAPRVRVRVRVLGSGAGAGASAGADASSVLVPLIFILPR